MKWSSKIKWSAFVLKINFLLVYLTTPCLLKLRLTYRDVFRNNKLKMSWKKRLWPVSKKYPGFCREGTGEKQQKLQSKKVSIKL